jgi:type IV secretory pathway VirB6-like protein
LKRQRTLENEQPFGGHAMSESTRDFFDTLAKALIRCWIFGVLLLLFSFVMFMLTGEMIDKIHGPMFGLSPHEIDVILYCGMALHKLFVNLFFLFPWIAIRMVLRKSDAT